MKHMKPGIILLALLLAAMAIVPLVSAGEPVRVQPSADSTRFINWAYQNEGKVVTAAQCLEKSAPGYWVNLSDKKKKAYSEIKVEIPDFHALNQQSDPVLATSSQSRFFM
jgi:hypothetical protein